MGFSFFTYSNFTMILLSGIGVEDYSTWKLLSMASDLFQSFSTSRTQFFLVTPINPKVHAAVCNISGGVEGRCFDLFPKYWNEGHFLIWNNTHICRENDLPDEARYQKGRLMEFIDNLRYTKRGILIEEIKKKRSPY